MSCVLYCRYPSLGTAQWLVTASETFLVLVHRHDGGAGLSCIKWTRESPTPNATLGAFALATDVVSCKTRALMPEALSGLVPDLRFGTHAQPPCL